jgi:hypothetical protein
MSADKPPDRDATRRGSGLGTLREVGTIFAPITLLTALLYFFGYLRERAFYSYFGLDLGSLGFSTTDYLVRSAETVFRPVAVLLAIALGAVVLHIGLTIALDRADIRAEADAKARAKALAEAGDAISGDTDDDKRVTSRIALAIAAVAVALLVFGIGDLGLAAVRIGELLLAPLALITGAAGVEYAVHLAQDRSLRSAQLRRLLGQTGAARRGLLIALAVFSAFWATSDLADREGTAAAHVIADTLPIQTKVIVFSRERLQLTGPGVQLVQLTTPNTVYHYRYNGLRLLLHTSDRWFIVRASWTPNGGQGVIILQDDPQNVRIEVAR